jgi:hypothetical protein
MSEGHIFRIPGPLKRDGLRMNPTGGKNHYTFGTGSEHISGNDNLKLSTCANPILTTLSSR